MALIDITAEIKGTSETSVTPIRIMSVTAKLTGHSGAAQAAPRPSTATPQPKKS